MMRLRMLSTLPDFRDKVHLQWTIDNPVPEETVSVRFSVWRAGTDEDDWEERASNLTGVSFTDVYRNANGAEINLLSLSRRVYYKVRAHLASGAILESAVTDIDGNTPVVIEHRDTIGFVGSDLNRYPSPASALTPSLREKRTLQVARKLVRDYIVSLRLLTGKEIIVLKRRQFGRRCTACYNSAVGVSLTAHCPSCYGTTWEGGYYPPILTLGKITPTGGQETMTQHESYVEVSRGQVEMIAFPRLEKDDVVVDVDTNDRWRVEDVSTRSLRGRIVKQDLACERVARTSAIYTVPTTPLQELPDGHVV